MFRDAGFRWGEKGKWNLEEKDGHGREVKLRMTAILDKDHDEVVEVAFPYFGNREHDHFKGTDHPDVLNRRVPVRQIETKEGKTFVATVFDLFCANYGLDRGLGGEHVSNNYADNVPYTPAWAEKITGVPAEQIITGHSSIALAGGAENYSRAPFVLRTGRWGHKRGDQNLQDLVKRKVISPGEARSKAANKDNFPG